MNALSRTTSFRTRKRFSETVLPLSAVERILLEEFKAEGAYESGRAKASNWIAQELTCGSIAMAGRHTLWS